MSVLIEVAKAIVASQQLDHEVGEERADDGRGFDWHAEQLQRSGKDAAFGIPRCSRALREGLSDKQVDEQRMAIVVLVVLVV